MPSGIYKITCNVNEKIYVGSAVNLNSRKAKHISELIKGRHKNPKLQNSFNKYGQESFEWSILELVEDRDKLIEREQHWIDSLNPEYNICRVAGSSLGTTHTEETKKMLSDRRIGVPLSEEVKSKMSRSKKGIPKSEAWKAGAAERAKKKNLSSETLQKRSEALRGRVFSDDWRSKISESQKKRHARKRDSEPNLFSEVE